MADGFTIYSTAISCNVGSGNAVLGSSIGSAKGVGL
jgi:hypothetical protein